jgi:hypothetical protein
MRFEWELNRDFTVMNWDLSNRFFFEHVRGIDLPVIKHGLPKSPPSIGFSIAMVDYQRVSYGHNMA